MKPRLLAVLATAAVVASMSAVGAGATPASAAPGAASYVVVFRDGGIGAGADAIRAVGGQLGRISKVGVATVSSSNPAFGDELRASRAVAGVARNAGFFQPALQAA